jgi:hypothetical protein
MVLGQWLARLAVRRPHALLAVTPGATAVRLSVEARLAETGIVAAVSPAEADLLIVAGAPENDLAAAIDEVWAQLPGPRVRVLVETPDETAGAISRAVVQLASPEQRTEAAARGDEWRDAGGMGMGMADRAPDRDGLRLDVLQVPLGPVLTDWPAGLVLTLALQGDVVQNADVRVLGPPVRQHLPFWDADDGDGGRGRRHSAAHLDSLGRLLGVVGGDALAWRARRLRDGALGDVPEQRLRAGLAALDRRMRRSRALRWATDGLGVLTSEAARDLGVTGPAARAVAGDVTARWRSWLAEADRYLAGELPPDREGPRGRLDGDRTASAALLDAAQHLMVGLDIAGARIVMASFDPDPDELAATSDRPIA